MHTCMHVCLYTCKYRGHAVLVCIHVLMYFYIDVHIWSRVYVCVSKMHT